MVRGVSLTLFGVMIYLLSPYSPLIEGCPKGRVFIPLFLEGCLRQADGVFKNLTDLTKQPLCVSEFGKFRDTDIF